MRTTGSLVAMTLADVRAEMEALLLRKQRRGEFHPAEYWRCKDLAAMERSLLADEAEPKG